MIRFVIEKDVVLVKMKKIFTKLLIHFTLPLLFAIIYMVNGVEMSINGDELQGRSLLLCFTFYLFALQSALICLVNIFITEE